MLLLHESVRDGVLEHALAEHPLEACGLLVAPLADRRALRVVPMRNAARSAERFEFDPAEQLKLWREMDARDELPVALYHSHTDSAAFPSREDIAFATDPSLHYLIVSTAQAQPALRSYRVVERHVVEETVVVKADR